MSKRQITMDEFLKEKEKEKKAEPVFTETGKTRRPYKDNIPKDYNGPVEYTFHDDWWHIKLGDIEIGAFTSQKSARGWAKMFIGREE